MIDQTSVNTLKLIEIFSSIQGETSLSGRPTTFVRLAACNLRCHWCDTSYSFDRGTSYSLKEILDTVERFGQCYVCITGGEPLLQRPVHRLMRELCDRGFKVSLETGGSLSTADVDPRVKIILDIKCPKSGMAEKNDWTNLDRVRIHDEIKFVLLDRDDYAFASATVHNHHLSKRVSEVLFSPVHDQLNPKQLVQWILEDRLPVRLNLQIHKFVWPPDTKGV